MGIPAVLAFQLFNFNVDPGPCGPIHCPVLNQWAYQGGYVSYHANPHDFVGRRLQGVHGRMDVRVALRTILAGTGLTYDVSGDWRVGGDRNLYFVIHPIGSCDPKSREPPVPPCIH